MFKKIIISSIFIIFLSIANVFAKEVKVEVDGMVCEFCANTIEKNFLKLDEIHHVEVDFDQKLVTIMLKDNQELSDKEITDIVVNNGYNVAKITR